MVPDHFEGMLSMCAGYVIGVIKGSDEDPCKTTDPNDGSLHLQADNNWEEPVYEDRELLSIFFMGSTDLNESLYFDTLFSRFRGL